MLAAGWSPESEHFLIFAQFHWRREEWREESIQRMPVEMYKPLTGYFVFEAPGVTFSSVSCALKWVQSNSRGKLGGAVSKQIPAILEDPGSFVRDGG